MVEICILLNIVNHGECSAIYIVHSGVSLRSVSSACLGHWSGPLILTKLLATMQVRNCITTEPACSTATEFFNTLEALQKIVVPQVPANVARGLQLLIDQARSQHQ